MAMPKKPTLMRFKLAHERPMDAFTLFYPKGHHVLNRTEWRGKEARSCSVTGLRSLPYTADHEGLVLFEVEVSYRPKGHITFVGETKYDGWTAMMLDKTKNGTLLDGQGQPLSAGQDPVYLPFEVYEDAEFNEMNFGEFLEEVEIGGVKHITHDELMQQVQASTRFSATIQSTFVAPRRQRPQVRIAISEAPLASGGDRSDMRVIFLDKTAFRFQQTLLEQLFEVASGFVEGRYSMKVLSTDDIDFVEFSDCIMELRPAPNHQQIESVFDVFSSYVSSADMEEIAKRLMVIYEVDVTVVDGKRGGFLVKRESAGRL